MKYFASLDKSDSVLVVVEAMTTPLEPGMRFEEVDGPPSRRPHEHATLMFERGKLVWRDWRTPEQAMQDMRAERNRRLAACDWVALRAFERGEAVPQRWLEYRQALRDITLLTDPKNIAWPEPPAY